MGEKEAVSDLDADAKNAGGYGRRFRESLAVSFEVPRVNRLLA